MHQLLSYPACRPTNCILFAGFRSRQPVIESHILRKTVGRCIRSTSVTPRRSIRADVTGVELRDMPDSAAASAELVAALKGSDQDALAAAIEAGSAFDEKPGDDRQRLRAARTKLKRLQKEEEAKKVAAANKAAADRSPHTKETYDAGEFEALVEKYEKLNWRIISKPGGATVKPDEYYPLYGLHMQAAKGDNTAERPMWAEKGGLDFDGRAKWDAWTAVKGMKADKVKLNFVKAYYEAPVKAFYSDSR